jgi:hypothetical protein
MALESQVDGVGFLVARVLFGAVLGYLALGNLLGLRQSIEYARSKGAPLPEVGVPLGSLLLLAGALSLVLGAYPLLATTAPPPSISARFEPHPPDVSRPTTPSKRRTEVNTPSIKTPTSAVYTKKIIPSA